VLGLLLLQAACGGTSGSGPPPPPPPPQNFTAYVTALCGATQHVVQISVRERLSFDWFLIAEKENRERSPAENPPARNARPLPCEGRVQLWRQVAIPSVSGFWRTRRNGHCGSKSICHNRPTANFVN
jgi:hypothetical protein